jgi:AcrR family transcriptional regulator
VIDAAERLLRQGKADFSMRDLAAEAGVSFATPFNQFGSKAAIMHAVAGRRVDVMEARFIEGPPSGDVVDRVLLAIEAAVAVMLEEPLVNRSVMGWLSTAGPVSGHAWARSKALWSLALAEGDGLVSNRREHALRSLPGQLAFGFRGVLSFWTAGEVPDEELAASARDVASAMMLGFVDPGRWPAGS